MSWDDPWADAVDGVMDYAEAITLQGKAPYAPSYLNRQREYLRQRALNLIQAAEPLRVEEIENEVRDGRLYLRMRLYKE